MRVEKSYLLASIMRAKFRYFKEDFVTKKEVNVLAQAMQNRFNRHNAGATIIDEVDQYYFKDMGDRYILNKDNSVDIRDIEARYQAYLPIGLLKLVWEDRIILKDLSDNFSLKRKNDRVVDGDNGGVVDF